MASMTLFYLGIFFGGTLLCLFRHPVWGIFTYVLVFYLDAPSRWWSAGLPNLRWSLLIVAITILSTVIYKLRSKDQAQRLSFLGHSPQALFFLYVIWMWLQLFWVISPDHGEGVVYFTKYLIVMYLAYLLVDTRERVIGFIATHIVGCFYLGLLAFSSSSGGRLDGVGGAGIDDSNNLGIYVATAAVAVGGMHFVLKGWTRWLLVLPMPFLLNTLVQAGSRGAFLALVGGFGALYLFRPSRTTKQVWVYGILGLFLFGTLASDFFWDRIASIQDAAQQSEEADTSAVSRIVVVKDQWRMALDHPFGAGHKGTAALSYQYIDSQYWALAGGRSSHNTLLSALVDQGFLGLLIWGLLNWKSYQRCRAISRWAANENDDQLRWLSATILSIVVVTWIGGIFAPFLKGEVFVWMIPLICSLWTISVGKSTATRH